MAFKARHLVPAGSFHISRRLPLLLQAYLGTCVAVSIYCKQTGLGGIIHLLLPKPVSSLGAAQPEKYASTGLPLFLRSLLEKGAHRDKMVACIAGGALVGPLNRQDLSLDIGGHTAEVARQILDAEKIDILLSETGGFFTCSLNLDMGTGQTTIEPVGQQCDHNDYDVQLPNSTQIMATIDHLQPIPQVALKVLRLMDDDTQGIGNIADEIRKDQVITAQALKLANSAIFTKRQPIESLEQALVYLGRNQMVKLILSAAVQSYFAQVGSGYSLCKGGLYYHAIGCAKVAEVLGHRVAKVDPARAYTAGLLHDIGKVVLDQFVAPAYPLFYRDVMENKEAVLSIEKRVLGIDHAEVGQILAEQWAFPPSLINVVAHHHQPGNAKEHKHLAQVVHLADLLLSRFNIGIELERIDTLLLDNHFADLNLSTSSLPELVDAIPNAIFDPTGWA